MTVVANIDLPIREDSTPWAAGTGSLTPTEKETLAQSGILTQDWSSDPALTPDETAELRSKQPTLTYMLGGSGIAFIKPGSYTAGNNGVLTLGTAFAVVYTWGAYFYVPASGIYSGSAAGWYWGVMSSSSSVTLYNNKYTSGTPAIPGTPTPFVTTGSGAVTSSLLEIPGPRYTLAAGALGINGTLLMQGRVYGTANSNNSGKVEQTIWVNYTALLQTAVPTLGNLCTPGSCIPVLLLRHLCGLLRTLVLMLLVK